MKTSHTAHWCTIPLRRASICAGNEEKNQATGCCGASGVGPSSSEGTFMAVKPTDARDGDATGAVDDDDADTNFPTYLVRLRPPLHHSFTVAIGSQKQ